MDHWGQRCGYASCGEEIILSSGYVRIGNTFFHTECHMAHQQSERAKHRNASSENEYFLDWNLVQSDATP